MAKKRRLERQEWHGFERIHEKQGELESQNFAMVRVVPPPVVNGR